MTSQFRLRSLWVMSRSSWLWLEGRKIIYGIHPKVVPYVPVGKSQLYAP